MAVSARFKVSRVTPMGDPDKDPWAHEVELTPDYADGANKAWSAATPAGVIRMTITNHAAVEQLPLGSSQAITFETIDE